MVQTIEFDGVMHEFPDDFTQDDISRALSSSAEPPAPPTASTPQGPVQNPVDTLNTEFFGPGVPVPTNQDALQLTAQSIGRGAADLAGAPVDIATMFLNAMGGLSNMAFDTEFPQIKQPMLGSDDIARRFSDVFPAVDPEALSEDDKQFYDVARFGSGAGMGGLGLLARAKTASNTGKIEQALAKPYVDNPTRQITQDVAGGAGAGYGVNLAETEDLGPVGTVVAPFAAAYGGGVAANTGLNAAESTVRGVKNMIGDNLPGRKTVQLPDGTEAPRKIVRRSAELLQEQAVDPQKASQNIKETTQMAKEAGVPNLPTGTASDDVGLSSLEVAQRTKEENAIDYMQRDKDVSTGLARNLGELSDETADIQAPQKVAKQKADEMAGEAEQQVTDLQENLTRKEAEQVRAGRESEELLAPVQSQRGKEAQAGQELDTQIGPEGALGERTKVKNEAFDEAAKGQKADITPIAASVKRVEKQVNTLGFEYTGLPKGFTNKIKKLAKPNKDGDVKPVPMSDISNVRKEISFAIARAKKQGEFNLSDDLSTLKKDINDMIDNTASFEDAQKYYREEYAPFFGEGYGREYRDTVQRSVDRTGKADPANTARFFLESSPDAARDLAKIVEIAPDEKAAMGAVERYMKADLASKLTANPSPRFIKNWIEDRADQLDQFPEIKAKFEDLQKSLTGTEKRSDDLMVEVKNIAAELKKAEANVKATERRINTGVLGTLLKSDPDKYVKSVMGSKDRLKQLDEINELIGTNKEAQAGLKQAVTEYLMNSVTGTAVKTIDEGVEGADRPVLYAKIAKTLNENREALAKVYSPKEMNVLNRVEKLMAKRGNTQVRPTTGSDTAYKMRMQSIGDAFSSILRFKFGALKGGTYEGIAKRNLKYVPNSNQQVEELISRAMLDPEIAVVLLDTPVDMINKPAWNKRLVKMMGLAEGSRQSLREDENE